jgi:hypothetical protein
MNTKIDVTQSDGPEIQPSVILNFLVKRCNEIAQGDYPKIPFVLRALGLAGLAHDPELYNKCKEIMSSPDFTKDEVIRSSIDIFKIALEGDPDRCPHQPQSSGGKDGREPDVKACKQFLLTGIREAKLMAEEADYRFLRIFEILAWVGLRCRADLMADFETLCKSSANDPENILQEGREILKAALFERDRN